MMDMHSRNQYLKQLRIEYLKTKSKKGKGKLLDEAEKRTGLRRKYLIRKLRHLSNLDKNKARPRRRKQFYDGYVRAALVRCWEIFAPDDFIGGPCGQRLKPLLKQEVERLRGLGELRCSDEVAQKLKIISARTIDEKLKRQKEVEDLRRKYHYKKHPLLYQKIPIKLSYEQDRTSLGNMQIDLVEHCGGSARGEYINTLSTTDISSGWWEGEAVMGRSQGAVFNGLKGLRNRFPFAWKEIHSDNGTEFINWHLLRYTQKEELGFSRSRPNKKNDNCFVEQKNWTHVKKYVGYFRYDTKGELEILNDLYRNELRLYKNLFQPVIKLIPDDFIGESRWEGT
jgi:Integrase core domain.